MRKIQPNYATTEPMPVVGVKPAPVKGRTLKLTELMATIEALRKEIIDSMDARDKQAERIAEQDTNIKGLYKALDRMDSEAFEERAKFESEIKALKALLKRYL